MHALPESGFVRLKGIIGDPKADPPIPAIVPVSKSTWWQGVREGRYPQPTRALGPRITAWSCESIRQLIDRSTANVAANDAAALTGKAPDYSGLDTSVLGQAYRKTLAPLEMPKGAPTPPAEHIAKLRANPHFAAYFDQHYGKGAAARYLKGDSQ